MKILVDTSIWSLSLRRHKPVEDENVKELQELIQEMRVQMIGPIRQEILSGISERSQYLKLRNHLRAFPDLSLAVADYELAADFFNINRRKGVQGSNTDLLICAIAERHNLSIFTTDQDFLHFSKHIPIRLHQPRE